MTTIQLGSYTMVLGDKHKKIQVDSKMNNMRESTMIEENIINEP